jgi:crotonobetainyl-CoA:carnitine CoA-transferase CaiB-like acyl-CoA transferase
VAPKAMGSAHPLNAPYQAFEASDKWIVVGGANQKHWLRTLEVLGASELSRDPRFATGADRMAHLKELEALLSARFRTQPAAYWLAVLEEVGVPCGPVNDMLQALADPQTIAREMVVEVEHSSLSMVKTLGLPIKFSETPGKVQSGAPLYGEHTAAILTAYGFDADEIAALQAEGAVATAGPVKDRVS